MHWPNFAPALTYGAILDSGLSATHEEYAEARERCPVLVFVQEDVEREPKQDQLLKKIQDWSRGHYTASFRHADDLLDAAVKALHALELSSAVGQLDPDEIRQRAIDACAIEQNSWGNSKPLVSVAVVCGPRQAILRPTELESAELQGELQQVGMFGPVAMLEKHGGTQIAIEGDRLLLKQDRRSFSVSEEGSITMRSAVERPKQGMSAIIEEDVQELIERSLAFANAVLEKIDSTNRVTHVAMAASMSDIQHFGWRTRAEHAASPNSMTVNFLGTQDLTPVTLAPAHRVRSSLRFNCNDLGSDLLVKLRREIKNPRNEPW